MDGHSYPFFWHRWCWCGDDGCRTNFWLNIATIGAVWGCVKVMGLV